MRWLRIPAANVTPTSLTLPSFAKINLSLRILGKRTDGYHEIRTVLQTISLHDELRFEQAGSPEVTLSCSDSAVPSDDSNLIVRAANALRERFGVDRGVEVHLQKNIAMQAGLGGASSNAAVSLLALTKLWDLNATPEEIEEIAAKLGADVPFFLVGGTALATGTGTNITTLQDVETMHLIVVKPHASVPTAEAYAAFSSTRLTLNNAKSILSGSPAESHFRDSEQWVLENDFESVIFDIEPEVRRVKQALLAAGASDALLAGSGSSVFGIFSSPEAQQRAIEKITLEAGWRMFTCDTLSRAEYARALRLFRD